MDRDQLDYARATERKAHEKERIDKSEVGHFRQARGYREQKGNFGQDRSQRDRYLSIVVTDLYPERRIRNRDHREQRQKHFPNVVPVPALNDHVDFKLRFLLAGRADTLALLGSLDAENLPLCQLNEGFRTDAAEMGVVLQRHRVALIQERLHENPQRLGVEGKRFQIEGSSEPRLEQFKVVDRSVRVAPDI